jgi:hypothetical protein
MLFANNANTTLASSIIAGDVSMVVTSATNFPSLSAGQYFYCTLADAATQTTIEIVKVTATSGTTFTITRAQDGTTASGFAAGAVVSVRLVRASLNDFPKLDEANTFTGAITFSTPLVATNMVQSTTSTSGYLTSTDWNTFNGKSNTNGTVTSVAALTLGTTGTDLSSTVANGTTTPVITLQVPTASATNRGALSAADWSTFNGKQAALVSGTNIKTVNGTSLLGSGDVGTIGVSYGGTGLTSLTANYIPYGNGTGAFSSSANLNYTNNGLLLGTTSNPNGWGIIINGQWGNYRAINISGAGTGGSTIHNSNTGGGLQVGVEASTGSNILLGTTAYAGVIGTTTSTLLQFGTNNNIRATIDTSGNLGINCIPAAWNTSFNTKAIQMGAYASVFGDSYQGTSGIAYNAYQGGNDVYNYIASSVNASAYLQSGGSHYWKVATSGTAGGVISFTQAMRLFVSGGLSLGNNTDPGATNLSVTGTVKVKDSTLSNKTVTVSTSPTNIATRTGIVGQILVGGISTTTFAEFVDIVVYRFNSVQVVYSSAGTAVARTYTYDIGTAGILLTMALDTYEVRTAHTAL